MWVSYFCDFLLSSETHKQGLTLCSLQVRDLRTLLRDATVATPCCDSLIPLSSCCTGEVECPECECEYRYSWCSQDLCDEESRPRNHCAICQTCRDYRDQHCSVSYQFTVLISSTFGAVVEGCFVFVFSTFTCTCNVLLQQAQTYDHF